MEHSCESMCVSVRLAKLSVEEQSHPPSLYINPVVIARLNTVVLIQAILNWRITALNVVVTCLGYCQGVESMSLTGQVYLCWISYSILFKIQIDGWVLSLRLPSRLRCPLFSFS